MMWRVFFGAIVAAQASHVYPHPMDARSALCPEGSNYPISPVTVSVVIPYLQEGWPAMLNTVEALLDRTPPAFLEEIIFISDGNDPKETFEEELKALSPKIKVFKFDTRQGLITAKSYGADQSQGTVIMFFEPHCIVSESWLEPLLWVLQNNPKTTVIPHLDQLSQDDPTIYFSSLLGSYRIEWNFNLQYSMIRGIDPSWPSPYYATSSSGGILALYKERYKELRLFDLGLQEWGGDQVELSFKSWRCGGGSVVIVPCSRVGHMFRDVQHRKYDVNVDKVIHNYVRMARVWLDDEGSLDTFYKVKPEGKKFETGNLTALIADREELQCKSHQCTTVEETITFGDWLYLALQSEVISPAHVWRDREQL
eukprot:GEMP01051005.1.p1 GENE.GEMP01051005.1~~GEMP01051005.1.p1  ORF type:complete len:367 (+),score=78.73 GEMP01051005.1:80-1180(+)